MKRPAFPREDDRGTCHPHKRPRIRVRAKPVPHVNPFATPCGRSLVVRGPQDFKQRCKSTRGKRGLYGERAANWSIARKPWANKSSAEWKEMGQRMYSAPRKNHAFWDWVELEVLEEYLARFEQEVVTTGRDPHFSRNWKNVRSAHDYIVNTLAQAYVLPVPAGMGLKQAIRAKKAVPCFQSFVDLSLPPDGVFEN